MITKNKLSLCNLNLKEPLSWAVTNIAILNLNLQFSNF